MLSVRTKAFVCPSLSLILLNHLEHVLLFQLWLSLISSLLPGTRFADGNLNAVNEGHYMLHSG